MTKVRVDRSLCIGCGTCIVIAPKTFELDSEGKSVVRKKDGSLTSDSVDLAKIDDTKENVTNAIESCPVAAISLIEE